MRIQNYQSVIRRDVNESFQPFKLRFCHPAVVSGIVFITAIGMAERYISLITGVQNIVERNKEHISLLKRIIGGAHNAAPAVGFIVVRRSIEIDIVIADFSPTVRVRSR